MRSTAFRPTPTTTNSPINPTLGAAANPWRNPGETPRRALIMEPMESPLSRVQAALAKLERPIICTNCGGRWFQIAEFHRLAQTGYASLEFDPTEAMSQTVRVCLCGKIVKAIPQVRAGPTPNAELKSFAESMDLAAEHPHTATQGQVGKVQTELNAVIEQAATRSELHL